MFVFAPLQAVGIYLFQGFAIAALLAVIGGMIVISENVAALAVMAICFVANVVVFVLRLYFPPWPYNLYALAGAWLAIAITLGIVVCSSCIQRWPRHLPSNCRRDPVVSAYRCRVRDAIHICWLVGSRCFQGNNLRRQSGSCKLGFLFEPRHPDVDRIRRPRAGASDSAKSLQHRKRYWSTLSSHVVGKTCDSRIEPAQRPSMSLESPCQGAVHA
jgi:hypothetical protein